MCVECLFFFYLFYLLITLHLPICFWFCNSSSPNSPLPLPSSLPPAALSLFQVAYALMLHVVIGYMLLVKHETYYYTHAVADYGGDAPIVGGHTLLPGP